MRISLGSRCLCLQAGDYSQEMKLPVQDCTVVASTIDPPVSYSSGACSASAFSDCPASHSQHWLPRLSCLLTQTGNLWTRLGSASKTKEKNTKKVDHRAPGTEEDDSELQRAWGALIKEKEQSRQKKSRLDNLPSLQIEVSRESSSGSEAESWCPWGRWRLP